MTEDALIDFADHPWSYEDARDEGLERAYGLRAVDGDTVDVVLDVGFRQRPQVRLRLAGVDTPEIYGVSAGSEEYEAGKEAQARVADLIEGQPLLVRSGKDTGKYGRWVSRVRLVVGDMTGKDLSTLLIEEGLGEADDDG